MFFISRCYIPVTNEALLRSPKKFLLLISGFIALMLWVFIATPRAALSDGLSLYNPVYVFENYHRIAYPAYYYFDNMPVHPPVYYLLLALLSMVGIPVHLALLLQVFVSFLIAIFCLAKSEFSNALKIAGILSLPVAYQLLYVETIRPDVVLSVLWFSGIVCLENARLKNFSNRWLAAGSLLVGFSSTLHYFASFAGLAVAVYWVYLFFNTDRQTFHSKTPYLLLPAMLVTVSYLLAFILPNLGDVWQQISATQDSTASALSVHFERYDVLFGAEGVFRFILYVPAAVWVCIICLFIPSLRFIAATSIPVTFFVLFYSKGKSSGYYLPEFFLFSWVVFYAIAKLADYALLKISGSKIADVRRWVRVAAMIGLVFYLLRADGILRHIYYSNYSSDEPETIRACSKKLLGSHAKVASRMDLWYVSGGSDWYNVNRDLLFSDSIAPEKVKKYLSQFDVVAEHGHMSNSSGRADLATLSSWYVDDTLNLKGFYLDQNSWSNPTNVLSFLFLSSEKANRAKGYCALNDSSLLYLEQDSMVNTHYFLSMVLKSDEMSNPLLLPYFFYNQISLPDKKGKEFQLGGDVKEYLVWGILHKDSLNDLLEGINTKAVVKDVIPLKGKPERVKDVLSILKEDKPIRFYRNISDFRGRQSLYRK